MRQYNQPRWTHEVSVDRDGGPWMTTRGHDQRCPPKGLAAVLSAAAHREGLNDGRWPGLTTYRFTGPARPKWREIKSAALCVIVQCGAASAVVDGRCLVGQFHYAVICAGYGFDCRVVEARSQDPWLCVTLEIEPQTVRAVAAAAENRHVITSDASGGSDKCVVSPLDLELMEIVSRFLHALSMPSDRRVLAPLYLQETVFRLLQREPGERLARYASDHYRGNPIAAALEFIGAHLSEPVTVEAMAAQVHLSASAFSRVFRQRTGQSPYQYLKQARLERARELFYEGRFGVAEVSREVGYTSVSHFIKEFRNRVGFTPGEYVENLGLGGCAGGAIRSGRTTPNRWAS